MALGPGTRLGAYEILTLIGSGGMGEVYRARDRKLDRDVAIKVLPGSLASDPERLARFEREAKTLAALNHPNIAQIFGIEDSTGVPALVMELVEGPTLADRITKGPIPLDEALLIAKQIAEALEAAHEQGIVHRDLKPANIKVRPDGAVKVLDFGLAKAFEPIGVAAGSATMSPTLSIHATQAGIILGTAAYMAPEQARGKSVDRRADIWAFGCVLFEMLTAKRAFEGDDISTTLASVLKDEPEWSALPAATPRAAVALLRSCLDKDTRRRLQAIGDGRIRIEDLLAGRADEPAPGTARRRIWPIVAIAAAAGAMVAVPISTRLKPAAAPLVRSVRFEIAAPSDGFGLGRFVARQVTISPDGARLVYGDGEFLENQLLVRSLDDLDAKPLSRGPFRYWPAISPDGKWVAFFTPSGVQKASIAGGPPITIARVSGASAGDGRGIAWLSDERIVLASGSHGLFLVSANGGEPTALGRLDPRQSFVAPSAVPGGRIVLVSIATDNPDDAEIAAIDVTSGEQKILIRGGSSPTYVDPGYLLYSTADTLKAVRFDPQSIEVRGDPVSVVEHVMSVTGASQFVVSRTGTLVYVPGGYTVAGGSLKRALVWIDRHGREAPIEAPPRAYGWARLSPDGGRIALDIRDQERDVWVLDVARHALQRLTFDPMVDGFPIWTPDGKRILFESNRSSGVFNVFAQASDGTGQPVALTNSKTPLWPYSISPDGRRLVLQETTAETGTDLDVLRLGDGSVRPEPLIRTPAAEANAEVSPDGRWIAYQSNQSGTDEVYVRPFPAVDRGQWQVSTAGGQIPAWAPNGRELFYVADRKMMAVPVQTTPTFVPGNPVALFDVPKASVPPMRYYDVSHDGQRFLVIKDLETPSAQTPKLVVVLNWVEELKARMK